MKMEDDLKEKKMEDNLKKMAEEPINLIGCDTIVNSPSNCQVIFLSILSLPGQW